MSFRRRFRHPRVLKEGLPRQDHAARLGPDSCGKPLGGSVSVCGPWFDKLGALLATAKDYSGTPHAGIPFDRPTGTRAAACSHKFAFKIVLSLVFVLFSLAIESVAQTPSGPVNISGQNGTVIDGVHITNPNGDCLTITNSTNITVRRSEIGPCGGHGINISGGGTINIYDSYIHPEKPLSTSCCDTHDGILVVGTSGVSIQGNVIAYGESNIEANNVSNVSVIGNLLLNPINSDPSQPAPNQSRGQNFLVYYGSSNVTVQNNYAFSSLDTTKYLFPENQEDSINFGVTTGIVARGNYVTGGHSNSGCGIIADDSANSAQFRSNVLVDTGQCGISIADGTNQVIDGNKILNTTPVAGGGNTAISVWKQYSSACGPVQVSNNIASALDTSGNPNSYWDGGGCAPVTLTNNVFDAAAAALLQPVSTNLPPPPIPPQPFACAVVSPYTNNTSLPSCGGSSSGPPSPPTLLTATVH